MDAGTRFFQVGAFIALLILVRHSVRVRGARQSAILFGALILLSLYREGTVSMFVDWFSKERPYSPKAAMGHIGFVNFVVIAGWLFTTYVSFGLATLIQRRQFPKANVFLTLSLSAVIATTISYAVEVTGIQLHLWEWAGWAIHDQLKWIPFGWPFDAVQGWANTVFMFMMVYCGIEQRLFSQSPARNALITFGLFFFWVYSFLYLPKILSHEAPTWLLVVYMLIAAYRGMVPRRSISATWSDPPHQSRLVRTS